MSTNQNTGIVARLMSLLGFKSHPEHPDNLEHSGDRDGALTLSEEPTAEEVVRVAHDKNEPRDR